MSLYFVFPKPRDWNALEDIVCDLFSRRYNNENFQRYGRSGQKQAGIDIVGVTLIGLLGVQCKHHPVGNIRFTEIEEELAKAEDFKPALDELIIVTSAERDATVQQRLLELTSERKSQGKFPVTIRFWDDICGWLNEFPDLVYKHFTRYFPIEELEHIRLSRLGTTNKATVYWPATTTELREVVMNNLGNTEKDAPYKLSLGLTTFSDVSFRGKVDLEIQLADLFTPANGGETAFAQAEQILTELKSIIADPFFANELIVYLQVRLTLAFLLGWIFRRVTHFQLKLLDRDMVWATDGLPFVPSWLTDTLPHIINQDSDEVVLILNLSRTIEPTVYEFVRSWDVQPKVVLGYELQGHAVTSAAHALSIAAEISRKIKSLTDLWGIRHIHLFAAMPAALATLTAYHLNTVCPISIYFRDRSLGTYRLGGAISGGL